MRYQQYLYYYRKYDGHPLSMGSQNVMLTPQRSFFRWLTRENYPLYNPARLEDKAALLSSLAAGNESDKP